MTRALSVWWDGVLVGALRIDDHGDLSFAYDAGWLADPARPAISVSLPKQPEPFDRRRTRPFFAGLLPEEAQREAAAHALGVSRANDFRLLEGLGGDVAGALTLWPEAQTPPTPAYRPADAPLADDVLVSILDRLPARPMLAGEPGLRLSLAGAQQKLPVVLVDGRVALPGPGQPTTHILKPSIARLSGSTANEALAMRLASACGLAAAAVEPRRTGGRTYLLVSRYDRQVEADGTVRRLHQEDFCQALGIAPEHKYAAEGGPIFRDAFGLVRRACATPAPALLRLLDAAIFNVIIGNADAHGKNFSLLYGLAGIDLAPLYDLLCTAAWPEVHPKLAMKVARRATLEAFTPDTWSEFGAEIGMPGPFVRRRAAALAAEVLDQLPDVMAGLAADAFGGEDLERVGEVIRRRAQRVAELSTAKAGA